MSTDQSKAQIGKTRSGVENIDIPLTDRISSLQLIFAVILPNSQNNQNRLPKMEVLISDRALKKMIDLQFRFVTFQNRCIEFDELLTSSQKY